MNRIKNKKVLIPLVIVICLAIVGIATAMSSTNYDLPWTTGGDSSGGGERSSENYQLTDVIGQTGPGTSSSANYKLTGGFLSIMPIESGSEVIIQVNLQGAAQRDAAGTPTYQVEITVNFWDQNATWTPTSGAGPTGTLHYTFTGTTTYVSSGVAELVVSGVADGTYDIEVAEDSSLANIMDNKAVQGGDTVNMGTLDEGDCNDNDYQINAFDWGIFQPSWNKLPGQPGYNPMADLNGDGPCNAFDWGLFQPNWNTLGPIQVF